MHRLVLISIGLLLGLQAAVAQSHADFSGHWLQLNERCDPKPRSQSYSYEATIDIDDTILTVDISVGGSKQDGELHLRYEIGGKELVYTGLDHDEFHTSVRWQGEALVFDIEEHERGHVIKAKEMWTLLDGGRSLKRIKQADEPGERVRTYVLEKR